MEPAPTDLERRNHRGHLGNITGHLGRSDLCLFEGDSAHVPGPRHLAGRVEGAGCHAKYDLARISLREAGQELQQPRRLTQADKEHTGRVRVECASVAHPPLREEPPATRHNVMARTAGRLVYDDETVDLCHSCGSRSPVSSPMVPAPLVSSWARIARRISSTRSP